ncbi:Abhydrolase domain-containing protein 16A [Trichinella zimbabwensis]|uniref:Abhydrolase domain-containing protein 16A n=1 Tax=Trichinella zimbabwensis TaxID=268475 RepID=A0A0V1I5F9_9BILA|nr:Abhydrolase domain-containing protein 16A [Trichinella zimbabwensis]
MFPIIMNFLRTNYLIAFGPNVYGIRSPSAETSFIKYNENALERFGNLSCWWLHFSYALIKYISPIWIFHLLRYIPEYDFQTVSRYFFSAMSICSFVYVSRYFGRRFNAKYVQFAEHLSQCYFTISSDNSECHQLLRQYEYDFTHFPTEYTWNDLFDGEKVKQRRFLESEPLLQNDSSLNTRFTALLSWLLANTIGIRLLYPASMSWFHSSVQFHLRQGRLQLFDEFHGIRYKIRDKDGEYIDCMLFDRRDSKSFSNGNILAMLVFMKSACPVVLLKRNFPFSHGTILDSAPALACLGQKMNRMPLMLISMTLCAGFKEEDIFIYAWSIGAYPATWAAMNYPNMRGLFLDATFDDILPLALSIFPSSLSALVKSTVRTYMNLNVAEQLKQYDGPVTFVRRFRDEILSTNHSSLNEQMRSIRTNFLINIFLKHRYPSVFKDDVALEWLSYTPTERAINFAQLEDVAAKVFSSTSATEFVKNDQRMATLTTDELLSVGYYLFNQHVIDIDSFLILSSAVLSFHNDMLFVNVLYMKMLQLICIFTQTTKCFIWLKLRPVSRRQQTRRHYFSTITLRDGGVMHTAGSNKTFNFELPSSEMISSLKISPNCKAVAYEQSQNIIKFVSFGERQQSFLMSDLDSSGASKILGFEWLKSGDILIVSYCEISVYQFVEQKHCLRRLRSVRICTNAYVYSPDWNLLVTWTHGRSTTFTVFRIKNSAILQKFAKFEVEHVCNVAKSQPLMERQVIAAEIYNNLYIGVLLTNLMLYSSGCVQVQLYPIQKTPQSRLSSSVSTAKLTDILVVNKVGKFAVHVVDNLLLMHQQQLQATFVFDLSSDCFSIKDGIKYHFPLFQVKLQPPILSTSSLSSSSSLSLSHFDNFSFELYCPNWIFYQPDIIVDPKLGSCLWKLEFNFQYAESVISSKTKLIAFLIRRNNAGDVVQKLLLRWLRQRALNIQELRDIFDRINFVISPKNKDEKMDKTPLTQNATIEKIFQPLSTLEETDQLWLAKVLLQYVQSLLNFDITVDAEVWKLLVVLLAEANEFQLLQEMLYQRVFPDLKPLALALVSFAAKNESCFHLALHILMHRKNSAIEVCEILLEQKDIISALKYARHLDAVDPVIALKLIEAAKKSNNPLMFYSVFQFFEKDSNFSKQLQAVSPKEWDAFQAYYEKLRNDGAAAKIHTWKLKLGWEQKPKVEADIVRVSVKDENGTLQQLSHFSGMVYLRSSLKGEAPNAIAGIPTTPANYPQAVETHADLL